ncbi:PEP-CTERM sorting domain-containing protein [Pelomonas sp. Root1217]|uniref:PEP-CTERM sorting domain-containing protein n=1 Tax=Pelomonas sp. Root1217 TaxID=1736430 RepID=UPI0009EAE145|nr:PEP-CTERM sorting domain-containing protein [Pelomonas sp. Root1217]
MKMNAKLFAACAALGLVSGAAQATLVATPSGPFGMLDDAFTASIYSTSNQGIVGLGFNPGGQLIRTDGGAGWYVHSTTADTTVNGANTIHSSTFQNVSGGLGGGYGITLGQDGFMYQQSSAGLFKINPATFVGSAVPGTTSGTYGIKTLSNGKIAYNGNDGWVHLYDPTGGTDTAIYNSGQFNDDLAVTPDGHVVVAVLGGCRTDIITQAGVLVNQQSSSNCADGMAYGQGSIFKNNTNGTLTKLSFSGPNYSGTVTETVIASGYTYGDLATVGPDNAFYITGLGFKYPNGAVDNGWAVVRISLTGGGGFGTELPEPATLALTGLALAGVGFARRRRAA